MKDKIPTPDTDLDGQKQNTNIQLLALDMHLINLFSQLTFNDQLKVSVSLMKKNAKNSVLLVLERGDMGAPWEEVNNKSRK